MSATAYKPGDPIAFISLADGDLLGEVWSAAPNASVWVVVDGERDYRCVKLATPKQRVVREVTPRDNWRLLIAAKLQEQREMDANVRRRRFESVWCEERYGRGWPATPGEREDVRAAWLAHEAD